MEQIVYTKEEALDIVAGNKFHNALFDSIADKFSSDFLMTLANKMNIKKGDLSNLDPNQLDGLMNALEPFKNSGGIEQTAYENVCDAVDKKIELFNKGVINIPEDMVEDMEELTSRMQLLKNGENAEIYDLAHKKLNVLKTKYAVDDQLADLDEKSLAQIDDNLQKCEDWHQDVTHLDDKIESNFEVLPQDKIIDFIKEHRDIATTSFSDYASLYVSSLSSPELNKQVRLKVQEKIKHTKGVLSKEDIGAAIFFVKNISTKDMTPKEKKLWKNFAKTTKRSIDSQKKRGSVFASAQQLIDKTEVQDGYTLGGRNTIPQKDKDGSLKPDSELALWLEEVRNLTIRQEAFANKKLTKEAFTEAFAANIETEYCKLVAINHAVAGKKNIKNIMKAKKIKINKSSFIGYSAAQAAEREVFADRVIKKIDSITSKISEAKDKTIAALLGKNIVDKIKTQSEKLDKKAQEKGGAAYSFTKNIVKGMMKAAKWGMAFGAASAVVGPIGVSLVSAASFVGYGYPFIKEYRKQKSELKKQGKNLSFFKYISQNKIQVAALTLNALAVATPLMSGSSIIDKNSLTSFAKANSGFALMTMQAGNTYRAARKNGCGRFKAFCKGAAVMLSGLSSFVAGSYAAEKTIDALNGQDIVGGRGGSGKTAGKVGRLVGRTMVNINASTANRPRKIEASLLSTYNGR